MARVAGINIPDRKQAWISLTHIYGIGRTTALEICAASGIKHDTKIEALDETEIEKLRKSVLHSKARKNATPYRLAAR